MTDHRQVDRAKIPVIVGAGQITDMDTLPDRARAPMDLMADAARAAARDAGCSESILRDLDSLVVIRSFSDSSPRFRSPFGGPINPLWSLSQRLGITPREQLHTPSGGNMPQVMLSRACERIAAGESSFAMIAGAEALRTELAARRAGLPLDWNEDAPGEPEMISPFRRSASDYELAHGMAAPINVYPLFEQAIRGARGRTIAQHQTAMGQLLARFAAVARDNPLATRRDGFSADEIVTPTAQNPLIGAPYTKLMNANAFIDQSAALLICSAAKADALGIAETKRVYLHGCAEAQDHWHATQRVNLHSSPAVRHVVHDTFDMAGLTLSDIGAFDIYSCFSSAVEVACNEIGLAEDDPRGLTVTGGLPYFGGPGNNYVTHSIAEMVQWARRHPGAFGLVTANGNVITKHAAGIFSTHPLHRPWARKNPADLQRQLDVLPMCPLTEQPEGDAVIESYTVMHNKNGPHTGIVIGRLSANNVRFIADIPSDSESLHRLEHEENLRRPGHVTHHDGRNIFVTA